jgi:hypothetical protein
MGKSLILLTALVISTGCGGKPESNPFYDITKLINELDAGETEIRIYDFCSGCPSLNRILKKGEFLSIDTTSMNPRHVILPYWGRRILEEKKENFVLFGVYRRGKAVFVAYHPGGFYGFPLSWTSYPPQQQLEDFISYELSLREDWERWTNNPDRR